MKTQPILSGSAFKAMLLIFLTIVVSFRSHIASANVAGGGTDNGPDVTVMEGGDDTVTMGDGIVSIGIQLTPATSSWPMNGSGPSARNGRCLDCVALLRQARSLVNAFPKT
jgi:hypothetical protein